MISARRHIVHDSETHELHYTVMCPQCGTEYTTPFSTIRCECGMFGQAVSGQKEFDWIDLGGNREHEN